MVAALIYLDRFFDRHENIKLTALNVHQLLLVAIVTARKFLLDNTYNNAYWASLGGVTTQELYKLETRFLSYLAYDLFIYPAIFMKYAHSLFGKNCTLDDDTIDLW
jgi:hypothetical protein